MLPLIYIPAGVIYHGGKPRVLWEFMSYGEDGEGASLRGCCSDELRLGLEVHSDMEQSQAYEVPSPASLYSLLHNTG